MMFKFFTYFFLLVFLGVAFSSSAHAQTELRRMEITQTSAPAQGVAVFRDFPDKAAIVIESPITTLRFSSNVEGIVREMHEPDRGRYVLIIEPYTQILVIDAPEFIQQRQRIGNPQAREVRYFEIKPEETTSNLISVIFNVTPPDAKLFVDGQETAINQTVQIAPGSAEVRLEREGYRTVTDVIEVNERNILFNYQLQEIDLVPVEIRSNVVGASVIIDGTRRGQIDTVGGFGLFLYPGLYNLILSSSGYVSSTSILRVTEIGENINTINLIRNIGELELTVSPADANISIDFQLQNPQRIYELPPGRYRIDIEKEGHISFSENIEIGLNERISRQINLIRNIGELELRVSPSDARIQLNRQDIQVQGVLELAPGRYRLEVEREYHEPFSESIEIPLNERISRVITLEAHTGTLQFTVVPSNAQVELVDVYGRTVERWTGIQILRNILAGPYTLKVSSAGHIPKEQRITIQRNQTAQVTVELDEGALENWTRDTQTQVVPVTNPRTGRVWMDRNLGASRAATSSTDTQAYGDLYQWGRAADGHQKPNSPTTSTLSSTDQPGHGSFIIGSSDWRSPRNDNLWQGVNGINNPCPPGYRLPTDAEWNAERNSWSSNNASGAFNSPLKLPVAGYRSFSSGSLMNVGSFGYYWSSTVSGSLARGLLFNSSDASMRGYGRAGGGSVRCLED